MTSKSLAQVLVRVLGVYLIIISLASLGNVLMFMTNQFRAAVVGGSLNVIVMLAAGIVLVRSGDRLGAWLTSDLEPAEEPVTNADILRVALAILGVWFLVVGLRSAAVVGVEFLVRAKWDETPAMSYLWDRQRQTFVVAIVDTIAGIILISGRGGIASAWARFRGRGEKTSEDAAE